MKRVWTAALETTGLHIDDTVSRERPLYLGHVRLNLLREPDRRVQVDLTAEQMESMARHLLHVAGKLRELNGQTAA